MFASQQPTMAALAAKITKLCSFRQFFIKNTRAGKSLPRGGEIDEFRFQFFTECKEHVIEEGILSQHVRDVWFNKFKNLPSAPEGEQYRKLFLAVCGLVTKWQALALEDKTEMSRSMHSSQGNSFGNPLPQFGGNQENVPPKKLRGRPPKARTPMASHAGSVLAVEDIPEMTFPSPMKASSLSDVTDNDVQLVLGKRPPLEELKVDADGIVRVPGDKGGYKKPPKSKRTSCSSIFLTNGMVEKIRARDAKRAEKEASKKLVPVLVEDRVLQLEQAFERDAEEKNSLIQQYKDMLLHQRAMIDAQRQRIYQLEEARVMQDIKFEALEERIMENPSLAPAMLEERFLCLEYVFVLFQFYRKIVTGALLLSCEGINSTVGTVNKKSRFFGGAPHESSGCSRGASEKLRRNMQLRGDRERMQYDYLHEVRSLLRRDEQARSGEPLGPHGPQAPGQPEAVGAEQPAQQFV